MSGTQATLLAFAIPLVALLGLAVGSFSNVVIHRVPAGLSVVAPRSACPKCQAPISSRDNVPVLSWLLLRGRCRGCATPISARYPLVEIAGGVTFGAVALWILASTPLPTDAAGLTSRLLELAAFLYLAAISISLAAIDLETKRLPDRIVLPTYAVGALLLGAAAIVAGEPERLMGLGIGAAVLFVFYFALAFAVPGGMGFGDVKLAGVLGIYLGYSGWAALAVGTGAAFVLGGVLGVILMLTRRAGRRSGIPFGPWMLAGAWIGLVMGQPVADAYLSLVGLV